VIDSPPVLSVPDTLLIAKQVDGVILIASPGKTMKNALEEAVTTLKAQPEIKILGITLNRANQKEYYGYYYYPEIQKSGFFERISNGFQRLRKQSPASKSNDNIPPKEVIPTNGRGNGQAILPKKPQNQNGNHHDSPVSQRDEAARAPSRTDSRERNETSFDEEAIRADIPEIAFSIPLGKLDISSKKIIALTKEGYATVGNLMFQLALDPDEIQAIDGIGPKSLNTIRTALDEFEFPEQAQQQEYENNKRERIEEEVLVAEALTDEAPVIDDQIGTEIPGPNGDKDGALQGGLEVLSKLAVQMPANVSKFLGSRVSARIIARQRWKQQAKNYTDE